MNETDDLEDLVRTRLGDTTILEYAVERRVALSYEALGVIGESIDSPLLRAVYQLLGLTDATEAPTDESALAQAKSDNPLPLLTAVYAHSIPDDIASRFDLTRLPGGRLVPQAWVGAAHNLLDTKSDYLHPHRVVDLVRFLQGNEIYIAHHARLDVEELIAAGIPPLRTEDFLLREVEVKYRHKTTALSAADYLLGLFKEGSYATFAGGNSVVHRDEVFFFRNYAMPEGVLLAKVREEYKLALTSTSAKKQKIPSDRMLSLLDRLVEELKVVPATSHTYYSYPGRIPKTGLTSGFSGTPARAIVNIPFWHAFYSPEDVERIAREYAVQIGSIAAACRNKAEFEGLLRLREYSVADAQRFAKLFPLAATLFAAYTK